VQIRVLVAGAGGKMGRQVVQAVSEAADMELVGVVDPVFAGEDAPVYTGIVDQQQVNIQADLPNALSLVRPDVVVDFTRPQSVYANACTVLRAGLHMVIGTTGLTESQLQHLHELAVENKVAVVHAPNFALGAVLMMRFAREAAQFFPGVEIVELHHDQKKDAPSGTAIKTAEMIKETWQGSGEDPTEESRLSGARGGDLGGIHIHSVRLPGLVAHQEVLFGRPGEILTIRHDSLDRAAFMPGVLLAIRRVGSCQGLVYGLEHLMFQV